MRRHARPLAAILLGLILAATSLTMAVARGQTRVAGEIVICTGYGMATIAVDENGQPAGPVHLCPDMVLSFFAAAGAPAVALPLPDPAPGRSVPEGPRVQAALAAPSPCARGPPLTV